MTAPAWTPPSDAEVIERLSDTIRRCNDVLKSMPRISVSADPIFLQAINLLRDQSENAVTAADALNHLLTRISSLERELRASDAALIDVSEMLETVAGLIEWNPDATSYQAIEAARRRSAT